uniref:Succinate dehydrogenase assembly factor 2, mitochondrial n=1 Tax=Aceria tosichella TaxID=561515 RepID=A0A6G1SJG9_9ACAR
MHCLVKRTLLLPRLSLHLIARKQATTASAWLYSRPMASPAISSSNRPFSSDTDFKPSEELAKERYDSRANEDIEKKRARLLYQSRKRGMLENGVILASFANKYLSNLDADHLDQYDRLINLPTNDWDIYYWATNTKPTPPEFETSIMGMLREHLNSKDLLT